MLKIIAIFPLFILNTYSVSNAESVEKCQFVRGISDKNSLTELVTSCEAAKNFANDPEIALNIDKQFKKAKFP